MPKGAPAVVIDYDDRGGCNHCDRGRIARSNGQTLESVSPSSPANPPSTTPSFHHSYFLRVECSCFLWLEYVVGRCKNLEYVRMVHETGPRK